MGRLRQHDADVGLDDLLRPLELMPIHSDPGRLEARKTGVKRVTDVWVERAVEVARETPQPD